MFQVIVAELARQLISIMIVLPSIIISTILLYQSILEGYRKAKKSDNAPANNSASDVQNTFISSGAGVTITFSLMFLALFILIFPWMFIYTITNAIFNLPRFLSVSYIWLII